MEQQRFDDVIPSIFAFTSQEDTIAKAYLVADRLIKIATQEELALPDELYSFSPLNMLEAYNHIRIFAMGFLELKEFIEQSGESAREQLKGYVIAAVSCYLEGLRALQGERQLTMQQIQSYFDESTILSRGVEKVFSNTEGQTWQIFMLHSLYRACDFMDLFISSYRSKKQLRLKRESDDSHRAVINAAGALLSAQLSLEKGITGFAKVHTETQVAALQAQLSALEIKAELGRQKKSEAGKTLRKSYNKFRQYAPEKANEIWSKQLKADEKPISESAMIQKLREEFSRFDEKRDNDYVPSDTQTIRNLISPIAIKLGVKRPGRPPKKK